MKTLFTAKTNTPFKVHHLTFDDANKERANHLQLIGFLPGEEVVVHRRAMFGEGPVVVRIGSSTFALRHSEATCVFVA